MSGQILNYSIKDSRRLIIFVSVSYEADLKKVREVLQELIDEDERILKDRKPVIVEPVAKLPSKLAFAV
jgi:small conductance mechanosensitive channel